MHTETLSYTCGDTTHEGYLAYEESNSKKPAVVIAHPWRGLDPFIKDKAELLAKWGYVAFAADNYGGGVVAQTNEEAAELMAPLFIDRKLLRKRINTAVNTIREHPQVDQKKIATLGFCFGGLTVIELMRSGAKLRGYISVHGLYGNKVGDFLANLQPIIQPMHGSMLILHGHDDPFNPVEDTLAIQKELNDHEVDWQMHTYGTTAHAFTNPQANDKEHGMVFNEKSSTRAWQTIHLFLEEIFQ